MQELVSDNLSDHNTRYLVIFVSQHVFQLIVDMFGRLFLIKTVHLEVGWDNDRVSFPDCTDFLENASQENVIKSIFLTTTPLSTYLLFLCLPNVNKDDAVSMQKRGPLQI